MWCFPPQLHILITHPACCCRCFIFLLQHYTDKVPASRLLEIQQGGSYAACVQVIFYWMNASFIIATNRDLRKSIRQKYDPHSHTLSRMHSHSITSLGGVLFPPTRKAQQLILGVTLNFNQRAPVQ
jgi:hypothetical protein